MMTYAPRLRRTRKNFYKLPLHPDHGFLTDTHEYLCNLKPVHIKILNLFIYFRNKYGLIFPYQATLASMAGVSRQYMNMSLGELQNMGLILVNYRHYERCEYRIADEFFKPQLRELMCLFFSALIPIKYLVPLVRLKYDKLKDFLKRQWKPYSNRVDTYKYIRSFKDILLGCYSTSNTNFCARERPPQETVTKGTVIDEKKLQIARDTIDQLLVRGNFELAEKYLQLYFPQEYELNKQSTIKTVPEAPRETSILPSSQKPINGHESIKSDNNIDSLPTTNIVIKRRKYTPTDFI